MSRPLVRALAVAGAVLLPASLVPAHAASGNADNGAKLHQSCLHCHGTELYVPPRRKVTSLAQLRKATVRWADSYNPKFTKGEIEDLIAFLDRDFYRFSDPAKK